MADLNRKSVEEFKQSEKAPLVVVLDNVRSMHNVGSVFRTADAFLIIRDMAVRLHAQASAPRYQ